MCTWVSQGDGCPKGFRRGRLDLKGHMWWAGGTNCNAEGKRMPIRHQTGRVRSSSWMQAGRVITQLQLFHISDVVA